MVMVAAMSVGALAMAHLTKVMAELRKTRTRTYVDRAVAMAEGHLEIARNVVNAARYDDEGNTALLAAMASDDGTGRRLLPGTEVEIVYLRDGKQETTKATYAAPRVRH